MSALHIKDIFSTECDHIHCLTLKRIGLRNLRNGPKYSMLYE